MTAAEFAAFGGLGLNILIAVVAGTWGIARVKDAIRQEIQRHLDKVDADFETLRKEFGETAAALRTKINEVELFTRDTFMRRDSFYQAMKQYGTDVRAAFERIETRLDRMEAKIDKSG